MYIISVTYKAELAEVDKYLKPHIDFLDKYTKAGTFILAGRKVPRSGGLIIANASSTKDIEAIIAEDPFKINNVADFDIQEFIPSIVSSNLEYLQQD